jgi:hypothetical protein
LPDGSKASFAESQAAEQQELVGAVLSDHYQAIRRRAKAIPTLGNLTLLNLSVNREAQNKDFATKKQLLIANTVLSLNGDLMACKTWNEEAISARAKRLAEAATQLYPG